MPVTPKPSQRHSTMPTTAKVERIAATLYDRQAEHILALDLAKLPTPAEAAVLATASSLRQAQALADAMFQLCKDEDLEHLGVEGYKNGQWILVDLNDVLVHIFHGEGSRSLFNLEGLWSGAPRIPTSVEAASAPTTPHDDIHHDEDDS